MWTFIPSALYFKVLGYPTDCKIGNQSTRNYLTGAVQESFIATDIICLLLRPSSLWIFPSSPHCYLELHGESSCPNTPLTIARVNPLRWLNCTEVIGPRDGSFCFKIVSFWPKAYGFDYYQTMTTKPFQNPAKNVILMSPIQLYIIDNTEVLGNEKERGKVGVGI